MQKEFRVINNEYLNELVENGEVTLYKANDPLIDSKSLELKSNYPSYNITVHLGYDAKTLAPTNPVIFVDDGVCYSRILEIAFKSANLLSVLKLLGFDEELSAEAHAHFLNELILNGKQQTLLVDKLAEEPFSYTSRLYIQSFPKIKERLFMTNIDSIESQKSLSDFYAGVHKHYIKHSKEFLEENSEMDS